jgi:predicted RNA-binding protein YlxR (DUF448 family)
LPQHDLTRFVRDAAGWHRDPVAQRKQPGRGAYLCSAACAQRAVKNRRYPGLGTAAAECGLIESHVQEMKDTMISRDDRSLR